MAFFTAFKIDWISLLWYLVVFAIAAYGLKALFYKPILGILDERDKEINRALDEAQDAVASVNRSRERSEQILAEASTHAQEIVRRAERATSEMHEDARREARVQADAIVAKARTEIERERNAAIAEIREQVVDLALVAASKVLQENLDGPRNRALIEQTVAQAELRA